MPADTQGVQAVEVRLKEIPTNVYALCASAYGVTIGRAQEKLKAIAATV